MEGEEAGCPHMWRLVELQFGELLVGQVVRYTCELCEADLEVPPGEHPSTV